MTPILGVDVSLHNYPKGIPVRTLAKLKRSGIKVVIARLSVGTEVDKAAAVTIGRTLDAGLVAGGYHFLTRGGGDAQGQVFADQLRKVGGARKVISVLDVESTQGNHPRVSDIRAWAKRVEQELGTTTPLVLYSNRSTAVAMGNPDLTPPFDCLWQALYFEREDLDTPGVSLPAQAPSAHFFGFNVAPWWQYGPAKFTAPSSGRLIALDGDAFYYPSVDAFDALLKPRPPIAQRPGYAPGYNAAVDKALALLKGMPDGAHTPALPAGSAAPAGYDSGIAAAIAAVSELRMRS